MTAVGPPFISALDNRATVLYALRDMAHAGSRAHTAASESDGLTGAVRDLLYGLNTAVDALMAMIEESDAD